MTGRKRKREAGMITVEGVLSLVPFIIVILGIISFINIFAVHNKIQYALYQIGSELSCYTYFYQALGVRAADLKLKEDTDANTEKLDGAMEDLEEFLSEVNSFEDNVSDVMDNPASGAVELEDIIEQGKDVLQQGTQTGRELISDPKALLRGFIYLGAEKLENSAKSFVLEIISNGMMSVYLDGSFSGHMPMTADEYLKYYGVKDGMSGLDFGNSELFSDEKYRMIDIVVEYDIEVYILKLFFKDPTIHVVQRCSMPAWLDGDGVTYSK
jgi:hypothetical protein